MLTSLRVMRSYPLSSALLFSIFVSPSLAIRAVASSSCASLCGDVTTTKASDIVCTDDAFNNTATGQAFQQCISCQANSTAVDLKTGDTDLKWVLYNLRYAMSSCLWGFNGSTALPDNPCLTSRACAGFQPNLEFNNLTTNTATFDYCADMTGADLQVKCVSCLQQLNQEYYIANFFEALLAGCTVQSSPTLPVDSTLFQQTLVKVRYTIAPTAPAAAPASGPLTLGARLGIAVGGIIFLLIVAGVTIICCGKRRRRAKLAERVRRMQEYQPPYGPRVPLGGNEADRTGTAVTAGTAHTTEFYTDDSKHSFSPYTSESESPVAYPSDKVAFSPYSSQYSSPVSARDALLPSQSWDWKVSGSSKDRGVGRRDQAYELDQMRKKAEDAQWQDAWAKEAAERGITAPVIRPPDASRARGAAGPP